MRVLVILCIVSIISLTRAGNTRYVDGVRNGKIIGGYDARPRSHPYLVALQLRFLWARMRLCSGSLLSERWILTAGHCVKGSWLLNWLTLEAVVGTSDLEHKASTTQTVVISERITHPQYTGGIGAYDIAMLKTKQKIKYNSAISPIEVPFSMGSYADNTKNLILAGWGVLETTVFIPAMPDRLQEAQVEFLPYEACYKAVDAIKEPYEDNPLDRKANICTGPLKGGVAACSGDSGGPLIQFIGYYEPEATFSTEQSETQADVNNEIAATTPSDSTTTKQTEAQANITNNEIGVTTETDTMDDTATTERPHGKIFAEVDLVQQYKDEGLIPVVIGVVSWGISPCGEVGAPTVYTNVSSYADFIHKYLYN